MSFLTIISDTCCKFVPPGIGIFGMLYHWERTGIGPGGVDLIREEEKEIIYCVPVVRFM